MKFTQGCEIAPSQYMCFIISNWFFSSNFQYIGWAKAIDNGSVPDDLADFLDSANVKSED